MKASEFLNKTKEEIQTQLDILLQSEQTMLFSSNQHQLKREDFNY